MKGPTGHKKWRLVHGARRKKWDTDDLLLQGKEEMLTSIPFSRPQDAGPSIAIVTKVNRIQDQLVKKHDIELHMHLNRLEIAPQIYGMSVSPPTVGYAPEAFSRHATATSAVSPAAGGFVCSSAASFRSRTCWWCGTLFSPTASRWTWWTTSSWPCCSTSETRVRSVLSLFCCRTNLMTALSQFHEKTAQEFDSLHPFWMR